MRMLRSLSDCADERKSFNVTSVDVAQLRLVEQPSVAPERSEAAGPSCERCGRAFVPRTSGRTQRFCSRECRKGFHNAERSPNVSPNVSTSQNSNVSNPNVSTSQPNVSDDVEALEKAPADRPPAVEFTWDSESVVLRRQKGVAVYRDEEGSLIIRQEREWNEEDDTFVVICEGNEQAFLDAICDALGIPGAP
jgi:hypothetical protein